jgi:ABC-type lipoprotein export system ATPase subunit
MQPVIECIAVERRFGSVQALQGVDIVIPEGRIVALSGPSGSGKTTLLNLLAGLDRPDGGEVFVLGHEVSAMGEAARTLLRQQIGLIFQSFALLPAASVYENIEIGLRLAGTVARPQWHQRISACLAALEIERWAEHRAYELSGGQQQRVAIARALAPGPRLILADEPTGDLDPATGQRVLRILKQLASEAAVTILIATHDPAVFAVADQHITLQDGRLIQNR